ncbi:MAG: DmsE family decaheme c-type cytochrome [Acidobacteria bacterium]|nr:MAG: DmsE family decaheme c-type cytochrome [Acidobacteriota bacterium]
MYPLIIGLLLFAGLLSQTQPAPQAPAQQAQPAKAATEPPTKVGNETCLGCHDIGADFSHTPHAKQECEACHGPGSAHVDSGGTDLSVSFKAHPPKWANTQCLTCHGDQPDISDFYKAAHGRNGLSCISCHQAHPEGVKFGLLKTSKEQDLCIGCHQTARADFLKPYHHPVLEDAMKCSDCHSPHAENLKPMMRVKSGSPQVCVSCHADKRGPFVFEHVPVRVNNCEFCHQPHGATNERMLRRNEVHMLCLECHSLTPNVLTAQPPAFHDLRSPRYRECTVCHREIHGSNANPAFLK